jgi:hypothetical protein
MPTTTFKPRPKIDPQTHANPKNDGRSTHQDTTPTEVRSHHPSPIATNTHGQKGDPPKLKCKRPPEAVGLGLRAAGSEVGSWGNGPGHEFIDPVDWMSVGDAGHGADSGEFAQ